MSNKSVVVLTPNGRRQNVKVTPNTTILQILEEVCRKQGFKAEEYDIRHHNKVLDATSIMRYTGLPNNAQLEMAIAVKARAETRVKVGLALESGDRVMGDFEPSDSLWHVVQTLCPNESEGDESSDILPVIFYVGREESGTENLKKTTLRSLGLTSGGAILRFFKKTPEELHYQANVSAPLSRPTLIDKDSSLKTSSIGFEKASKKVTDPVIEGSSIGKAELPPNSSSELCNESSPVEIATLKSDSCPSTSTFLDDFKETNSVANPSQSQSVASDVTVMEFEDSSSETTQMSSTEEKLPTTSTSVNNCEGSGFIPSIDPEETIVFLGERNAVLFDSATARACKPEDVPDDFFELTFDDAKQLLRDLKRRQAALEEQPLVTSQYRELEKSKHMLNVLHQYKRCVIKVQFPNQLVLQGTFKPLEKVSHVMDFIRSYLQDSSIDFHIFTAPPKEILSSEQSLFEANCVPGALVHFISSAPCPQNGSYIREDIMAQVTTASAAAAAAADARMKLATTMESRETVPRSLPTTSQAHSSSGATSDSQRASPSSQQDPAQKVPKWFKPTRK